MDGQESSDSEARVPSVAQRVIDVGRRTISFVLWPPWSKHGSKPLTLAVPDARSTFKQGDVGWHRRPPARIRCPRCQTRFTQEYANDVIRCPTCQFERDPAAFDDVQLLALECPECPADLETGIRHPNVFNVPQWAACPECQYHWEFGHDFR